ncbi:NAD(P)H-hydrate epimerase [Aeromicrobium alkaliterrae]|uniref:ADP-dependent (S)-NAD(P)H-hydrate dehydratase n=1 Tax=Aeromicrobium alkaliterrae TaxID=302168 RepID=A0ABN2KE15_9ACTN
MLHAHDVAAVRAAEELAARDVGWDALMQQAADALAEVLLAELPSGRTPVFLVGPGNNGGDALFAAARVRERGFPANVCLLDPEHAHEAGLAAARAAGVGEVDEPHGHTVVVDGILGIGARAGLSGRAAGWAAWQAETRPYTVAVDVPSGIGVDDGTTPGPHLVADRTVTFGTSKPGLLVGPAADAAGTVTLAPIGLGPYLGEPVVEALTTADAGVLAPAVPHGDAHKYTRGVVGVRAGSTQFPGAAHLVVAGAQSGPAGYVRFVGDDAVAQQVVLRAPEVVPAAGRVQAWVVGPGGGDDAGTHLSAALADDVPVVVDATALQHLPDHLRADVVLTPHAGELATLLDVDRAEVESDPWTHARTASGRWGATVLLKGRRTIVVAPTGPTRVNLSGTAWLGTAGSGDVLSGLLGSLLASGLPPRDAASVGAFLHGAAAVRANPGGPVTATAVAAAIPAVLADFLAGRLTGERDW